MKSTLGGKMPYKRRCRWSRKASTENSMVSNWINVKTYKLTERIFLGTNNHSIWGAGRLGAKYLYSSLTFIFGFWVWGSFFPGQSHLAIIAGGFFVFSSPTISLNSGSFGKVDMSSRFFGLEQFCFTEVFLEKSNHFGLNLSLKNTNIRISIFQVKDLKLPIEHRPA